MDDQQDIDDAAFAEQQLQERRYRETESKLKADPGYFDWLLAAEAASRTETNDGDHGKR